MTMKKGFTLIELLAVILVLALIVLIATPLILNVVEESKKKSAELGAQNYLKALETYISLQDIDNYETKIQKNKTYKVEAETEYEIENISEELYLNNLVKVNGEYPVDGYVKIDEKDIEMAEFNISSYMVECDNNLICKAIQKSDGIVEVQSVEIENFDETKIRKNDTMQLTAKVLPKRAKNKKVSWTSSNSNVATITDDGLLKIIGYGETIITVKTDNNKTDEIKVSLTFKIKETSIGNLHSLAIDESGNLWAWGNNDYGQLGNGTTTATKIPIKIKSGTRFKKVSAGYSHSIAIDEEGNLWTWGHNGYSQLGNNSTTTSKTPIQIKSGTKFKEISAGLLYNLAIDEEGNLWGWGYNGYSQLGNNGTTTSKVPIKIKSGTKFKSIAAGHIHSMAIDEEGNLWTWGYNNFGQLGNGTTTASKVPIKIKSGTKFKSISTGYGATGNGGAAEGSHSLAIDEEGNLWIWGRNTNGELGNNSTTTSKVPIQIKSGTKFKYVTAGRHHSLAIDEEGNLWTWGYNNGAVLGNNSTTDSKVPVKIKSGTKFEKASTIEAASLAIDGSGNLWAWGTNSGGLGVNSSTTSSKVPLKVSFNK